jgi:hypothetical protein
MLTWHYLLGPPYERGSAPLLIAMGLSMALVSLLAISGGVVSLHWPERVAALVAGTAVIGGVLICLFDWPAFFLWQLLFELATGMTFQIVVPGGLSWFGVSLLRSELPAETEKDKDSASPKLSVRDLFLLVTAFALIFAVMPIFATGENSAMAVLGAYHR